MHDLINWLLNTLNAMGYPGIFALMAMESSIIPVPSELVMPPAGYLAHQGQMNIWIAILMGTLGSLVGAYANYFVSRWLGRPLVLKYGKYFGITEEKVRKSRKIFSEAWRDFNLHRPLAAGHSPPDLHSGRYRRDESSTFFPLHPCRRRDVVYDSGLDRLLYRQRAGAHHEVLTPGGHRGDYLQCRSDRSLCLETEKSDKGR